MHVENQSCLSLEISGSVSRPDAKTPPTRQSIVGLVAFTLPVLVVVIGMRLDRSPIQPSDLRYTELIQIVLWGSIALAALVPVALIMTSTLSWPRKLGLTLAMWSLLVLECGLTFYIALL
jgi:hypothetical protein